MPTRLFFKKAVSGNVLRLGEDADFHHLGSAEMDAEKQLLINRK
jgi:hypothetical protein